MSVEPVRVATLGIGWWSNVLADAVQRTPTIDIVSCYTRSREKRQAFAQTYGCRAAESYDDILCDETIDAILTPHPTTCTWRPR